MSQDPIIHPCLSCGACCAFFRVTFPLKESQPGGAWKVPASFIEPSGELGSMMGTTKKHQPCCQALTGVIGKNAHCSIYENRPTPCRNFAASYENGVRQKRCDEARQKHGLRPLNKDDFKTPEAQTPAYQ